MTKGCAFHMESATFFDNPEKIVRKTILPSAHPLYREGIR